MPKGYKGNVLGLTRSQVELAHNTATAVRWRIDDYVRKGMPFEQAKAKAISQAAPAWKGFTPDVEEAVRRIVESFTYQDLDRRIHTQHIDEGLASIERSRGYEAGRIERWLYRWTGMVFSV